MPEMKISEIDFGALELRDIGTWPLILRVAIIIASGILAIIVVYFVVIESQLQSLDTQEAQLVAKRNEFKDKYNMAVNLDAYKQQMIEMQGMYKEYLKALPSESDIPNLIDDISRLGEKNNLKFGSIKVGDAKVASGFYMELPIDLVITGSYNNIGKFISDLSKLPRIVTIEDFSIKLAADDKSSNSGLLLMNLSTKTYWVVSQAEQQAADGSAGKTNNMATPVAPPPGQQPGQPIPPPSMPGAALSGSLPPAGSAPKTEGL